MTLNSVTKIFVIMVKGFKPATSCARDQDATTAPARHRWETGSLNWSQFMLQWFIRFPKFTEFTEFLFQLGKTPLRIESHLFATQGKETLVIQRQYQRNFICCTSEWCDLPESNQSVILSIAVLFFLFITLIYWFASLIYISWNFRVLQEVQLIPFTNMKVGNKVLFCVQTQFVNWRQSCRDKRCESYQVISLPNTCHKANNCLNYSEKTVCDSQFISYICTISGIKLYWKYSCTAFKVDLLNWTPNIG